MVSQTLVFLKNTLKKFSVKFFHKIAITHYFI